jgi:hypothetical protein
MNRDDIIRMARGGKMNKWMEKAIANGTPEFRAYAEYVTEAMPDVTLPVLREMYKYNASVREYQDTISAMRARLKVKQ